MNKENETTEYKLLCDNGKLPDSFIKEIIAFVNTDGGSIYLGVADDGTVIGLDDPDDVKKRASSVIRDNIRPEMLMFISIMDMVLDGKNVVRVEVQRGTERPYYINSKGIRPEGVYIRSGSSSVPANESSIKQMLMDTAGRSYEKERSIVQNLTFTALKAEMKARKIPFEKNNMLTLGMLGTDGLYTNLALLLSDQCPFTIKVAVFEGNDSIIFKDRREFSGSVLTQLDETLKFIDYSNKTHAEVGAKYREDRKDYPPEAIREAVLNCIVHRDYSFSSGSIVNIYADHMDFISIGSLVSGLSMEAVMHGVSQSRNPKLAQLFYRLSLVESYGTGIRKMIQLFNGYRAPEFSTEIGGFFVTMYNRNSNYHDDHEKKTKNAEEEKEKTILTYCNEHNGITRGDVESLFGIKQTSAYNLLKSMCTRGILTKITEGKFTRYIQNPYS